MVYAAFAAEAVGGAMLALGIQTRWVALALSPILIGAALFVHGEGIETALVLKTIMSGMSMVAALSAAHGDEIRNADRKHSNWSPSYGKYTCSVLENVVPRCDN